MEKRPEPDESATLRFVLDGVYYALQQNIYPPEQRVKLEAQLQDWFPGIHFVIKEDEIRYFEHGEVAENKDR